MSIFSNNFSILSNSFTDLFGSGLFKSRSKLLSLQMDMLNVISQKINVIQEQLDVILENQKEIAETLGILPKEIVKEIYESDLNGLFILTREKIEAYIFERNNKTLTDEKTKLIFDEILIEIQIARAKIFGLNSFLHIPLLTTCLHFEIFCMFIANQPQSYINVTLQAYKKLLAHHKESVIYNKTQEFRENLLKHKNHVSEKYYYTSCINKTEVFQAQLDPLNDPTMVDFTNYYIVFKKYKYKYGKSDFFMENQILVENNILNENDLNWNICLDSNFEKIEFNFSSYRQSRTSWNHKPLKINDSFIIEECYSDLSTKPNCDILDTDISKIELPESLKDLQNQVLNDGNTLIVYASLLNIINETTNLINSFQGDNNLLTLDNITEFGDKLERISTIRNNRTIAWINFIEKKSQRILEEEKRQYIENLKEKMKSLSQNSDSIYADFKKIEEEIAKSLPEELLSEIFIILEPIGKELERGIQNIVREHNKFTNALEWNMEKAIKDVVRELENAGENIVEAVNAAGNFVENQFESYGKILSETEKRIFEGKIIDAVWHIGIDHLKHTEDNAAVAFMESSLLTSIASSLATIYGAPYGGAAFAAWLTYKKTGDLTLAIKTGTITYLTQQSLGSAKSIQGSDISGIAKRTLATSLIGGASIAAIGGSEKDLIDGMLKGAALTLCNEYYKSYVNEDIDDTIATEEPIDKDSEILKEKYGILTDKDGNPLLKKSIDENGTVKWVTQIDPKNIPKHIPQIGIASTDTGFFSGSEHSFPLKSLAKIPGMNAMARFHDQWCAINETDGIFGATQVTIIPAIALTIGGRDQILIDNILSELNENRN